MCLLWNSHTSEAPSGNAMRIWHVFNLRCVHWIIISIFSDFLKLFLSNNRPTPVLEFLWAFFLEGLLCQQQLLLEKWLKDGWNRFRTYRCWVWQCRLPHRVLLFQKGCLWKCVSYTKYPKLYIKYVNLYKLHKLFSFLIISGHSKFI